MQRNASSRASLWILFFDRFIKNAEQTPVKIPITNGSQIIPTTANNESEELPFIPFTMEICQ